MITIGIMGTLTIGMITTTLIETTDTIDTNEFFIYSGPEKNRNKDGGDEAEAGGFCLSGAAFNQSGCKKSVHLMTGRKGLEISIPDKNVEFLRKDLIHSIQLKFRMLV